MWKFCGIKISVFISKIVLEHSHAHLFINGLWQLSHNYGRALKSCPRDDTHHKA